MMESTDYHVQLPASPGISSIRKLCYGVGHVLNDLCASMWFSYLIVYFHSVARFSNKMAGYVMLIGQISDGLCTPFIGYESDRTRGMCGYGKRKSWHLVGTICVVCSFPFIFTPCIDCARAADWARLIYYAPFVVIFQFGWAATQISHLSLIPEITRSESERVELNAIRYSFTVISNVIVYGLTWLLIDVHTGAGQITNSITPKDSSKFMELTFIVLCTGLLFSVIFHVGTPEANNRSSASAQLTEESMPDCSSPRKRNRRHDVMIWTSWFRNQQFYLIAVLYMGTRLTVNMSQVYLPIFLTDTLNLAKSYIAIIPLVVYLSSFVASVAMKVVNKYIGRKGTFFLGTLLIFGSCTWFWFIAAGVCQHQQVFGAAVLLGAGCSTMLVTSLSMTADLIADNTESSAFVFGAMSLCDKLANGVGVVLVQQLQPCHDCCDKCSWYYQYVIVFVTGGAALLALVALFFLLPQTIGQRSQVYHCDDESEHLNGASGSTVPILPDHQEAPTASPVRQYGSLNSAEEE